MKEETSNKVNSEEGVSVSKDKPISKGGLSYLPSFPYSRHKIKRLGRGKSSGHGGTSTKGHKGQKSRSGFGLLRGFEGGQMPLVRRLPKFGFTNGRFKVRYNIVNLLELNRFDSEVDPALLYKSGLVGKKSLVKILAQGSLNKPLKVKAHHFSQKAIELIEKAGGVAEKIKPVAVAGVQKTKQPLKQPVSAKEDKKADSTEHPKGPVSSDGEEGTETHGGNGNTNK